MQVVAQRRGGGRVQRDLAGLAELTAGHREDAAAGVEVTKVEADRFPDPQAADCQQADQGLVSECPQRGPQPFGRVNQGGEVVTGIQVGHRPVRLGRQQARWWHLCGRVEETQPAGEAAYDRQAHPQPAAAGALGQGHPGHRVLDGDRGDAVVFQVGEELGQ